MTFSSRHPYAMSSTSRDVGGRPRCHWVCVLSEKETSEGRSKQWEIHISNLYYLGSCFCQKTAALTTITGESSRDKGILDLKKLFIFEPAELFWRIANDEEMTHEFFHLVKLSTFCVAIFVLKLKRIMSDKWFFFLFFFLEEILNRTPPPQAPNGLSVCHKWLMRCSFFAWKDRVTLPVSLPSISVYLGV